MLRVVKGERVTEGKERRERRRRQAEDPPPTQKKRNPSLPVPGWPRSSGGTVRPAGGCGASCPWPAGSSGCSRRRRKSQLRSIVFRKESRKESFGEEKKPYFSFLSKKENQKASHILPYPAGNSEIASPPAKPHV